MNPLMLATSGDDVVTIAVVGGIALAALSIVTGVIRSTVVAKHREQTKREIAAYVAEGSMTPDEGERLIKSGDKRC